MRQSLWARRLLNEKEYWNYSWFVTWTYNDDNLPNKGDLCKKDMQDAIKRLRKTIDNGRIKYYICGEYGEKYGRPHYHGIVFCNISIKLEVLRDTWGKGFIEVKNVNEKTVRYVGKYVTKAPLGRSRLDKKNFKRCPEFAIISKGIGLRWIEENAESVGKRGILRHGRQVCVPRYYINKMRKAGVSDQIFEDVRADRMQSSMEATLKLINQGLSYDDIKRRHEDQVKQRIEELRTIDEQHYGHDNQ